MGKKVLMKGNEAIAEAAIQAGCRHYFGYPITPQTEIAAYMALNMPKVGGVFLQAESEISAINMVYGAAAAGVRVMTSSSSPGISLKQEGMSYIAGCELPCVVVNIMRAGPGLGGILASQSDYFQMVKGGGHGDYRNVVIAPDSVQELYDLTQEAFDIADRYRITVVILGDGNLGQMMEPVEIISKEKAELPGKDWAVTGTKMQRPRNVINSLEIIGEKLERHNRHLQEKYAEIQKNEVRYETYECDDAELAIVAFGTTARIAESAVNIMREEGMRVGLIRPITLWPFPAEAFDKAVKTVKAFLSVEMNAGQMVEDVRLAVAGRRPVYFHGRTGGMVPTRDEIVAQAKSIIKQSMD